MAARHRLPAGFKRVRVRRGGTPAGWHAGLASVLAALYGETPPMTPSEQAEYEQEAAAVPYRRPQGALALKLREGD